MSDEDNDNRPFSTDEGTGTDEEESSYTDLCITGYCNPLMDPIPMAEDQLEEDKIPSVEEITNQLDPGAWELFPDDRFYKLYVNSLVDVGNCLCHMLRPYDVLTLLERLQIANVYAGLFGDPMTNIELPEEVLENLDQDNSIPSGSKLMAVWFVLNFLHFRKPGVVGNNYAPLKDSICSLEVVWNYLKNHVQNKASLSDRKDASEALRSMWHTCTQEISTSALMQELGRPLLAIFNDNVPEEVIEKIKSLYQDELKLISDAVPTMAPIPDSPATSKRSAGDQACPKEAKASRLSS